MTIYCLSEVSADEIYCQTRFLIRQCPQQSTQGKSLIAIDQPTGIFSRSEAL